MFSFMSKVKISLKIQSFKYLVRGYIFKYHMGNSPHPGDDNWVNQANLQSGVFTFNYPEIMIG